jgi:zinc transport system substrate-binding protein
MLKMKRNIKIILALIITLFLGVALIVVFNNKAKQSEKLSIVTTNFPAYDFARAVAGDRAEIKMLIKPGAELHDFEPSPQDIIDIKNSDLFIYTGGESDEWVESILDDTTNTLQMMDSVNTLQEEIIEGMESEDEGEGEDDEHVWTSLRNAIKIIHSICEELSEISPENQGYFEENAKVYTDKLSELDTSYQYIVKNAKRKTLVFGDRFPLRYFVEDYKLDYYAAFPGCAEQTEASSKTIAFLVDKVRKEKIPVVLKIELSSDKTAQTIADETGAKVLTFNSAHNISADDFTKGVTYADIMESNLAVLEEALQ